MTEAIRKKEKAVKASFRIEMTDEERKLRDSQVTNQYHTGSSNAVSSKASAAASSTQQITMSREDQEELEADRLAAIAEDGQRESSDDGDNDDDDEDEDDDDPDDDLTF